MKEVLVVSSTQSEADRLMDKFIYTLSNTGELDHVDRRRKFVYLKKSYMYRFLVNRNLEGYKCEMITGVKFEEMMKTFNKSWKDKPWITRVILKIFNKFKKDKD